MCPAAVRRLKEKGARELPAGPDVKTGGVVNRRSIQSTIIGMEPESVPYYYS